MRRSSARGARPRAWFVLSALLLPRRGIVSVTVLALLATLVVAAAPIGGRPVPPPARPVAIAPDEAAASLAARSQGTRVEVANLRSESSTTFANPDGTWTLEQSAGPVRVRRGAGWVPVNRALGKTAAGTLAPQASPAAVEFSAGGHTPLASFSSGASRFSLFWPGVLPAPTVDGDTATYADVLPGVDLRVRATDHGFGHDIVVKDAAAAANPALARITLGLTTTEVALTPDRAGNLSGVDAEGNEVFHAPAPLMWDSPANGPRTERRVGVRVGADTITLVPDRALLRDPKARFPLVIDPTYSGYTPHAGGSWTLVRRSWPTIEHWNLAPRDTDESTYGVARAGKAPGEGDDFLDRSLFKFDTTRLAGTDVISATFQIWQVWKYAHTCDANAVDPVVLYQTGNITSATNWGNQPGLGNTQTSVRSTAKAGQVNCPPNWVGMNATAGTQLAADAGAAAVVLGLRAGDEVTVGGWKRFYSQNGTYPKLAITYNSRPTISAVGTEPALTACKWCGGVPYVGATTLNLKGTVTDPNGGQVRGEWVINKPAASNASQTLNSGAKFATPLDTRPIANGTTVTWSMRGHDGALATGYVAGPKFVVDRDKPRRAPKVSAPLYKADNRWHGGVGVPDTFTFTPDPEPDNPATPAVDPEVNDIDHYLWGWQDPPATKVDAAGGLGGSVRVPLSPPGDGPRTLYVRAVDRAKNESPTMTYRFYVRAGNGALAQWSLEGNTQDTAFLGDRHGTLTGNAAYVPGTVGNALDFDRGSVAAPNAVATDASFTASAWVRVDEQVMTHTAVSQSGNRVSAFQLGYRNVDDGRWFFWMPRTDDDAPTTDIVYSSQAASSGWHHLAGVYDAVKGEMRLYVDGELSATASHAPAPFAAGQARIGNGMHTGVLQNHWLGAIDEVQLHDRALTPAEITAVVSQSDVRVAHWKFDEAVDTASGEPGTTARNAVDGGDMAVLQGSARFSTTGAEKGSVEFPDSTALVTTNNATVRTDQSFSVTAWVRLGPPRQADGTLPPIEARDYAVISQDGQQTCAFCLRYEQSSGKWAFSLPAADDPAATQQLVRSADPAIKGDWTHLAGVYNAASDTLTLYVDGEQGTTRQLTTSWRGTGALRIGQTMAGGDTFLGGLDDVRVYGRVISQDEVNGLVSSTGVTVGEWRLDGDMLDSSGAGKHGIAVGEPDWTAGQAAIPNPADRALRLGGTGTHVEAPNTVDTDTSFSVTVWARADQVGRQATVVSQDGTRLSGFAVRATAAGAWAFALPRTQSDSAIVDQVTGGSVQIGAWTHLAAVYSASRQSLDLYVNGVLTNTAAHPLSEGSAGKVRIGAGQRTAAVADPFDGAIDDVALYRRTLSVAEIRSMAGRDLSLVHNWQLDETSGTNAADSVGTRAGTLRGGTTFGAGRVGNAAHFHHDGDAVTTTGVDLRTDQSFTVAAWVRLDGGGTTATAVSVNGTTASKFRLGYLAPDRQHPLGSWAFEMPVADADGVPVRAALSTFEHELTDWVHLVGVYDATSGMLWLYVDGVRQNDHTLDTPWHGTGGLQIGRALEGGQPTRYWPGAVDEVRLYTGALDAARVSGLFQSFPAPAPPPEPPDDDAGHWTFDESSGTVAADSSGFGRDATFSGGVTWIGGRKSFGVRLDGTTGHAKTAGPVLDTARSFSVSAWAYLSSTTGGNRTVVGQDGSRVSAFQLQYNADTKRWAVLVPTSDTDNPETVLLTATEAAWVSDWTHLALVYDAEAHQLRLFVNGVLAATRYGVTVGASTGPLTIGRGTWNGEPTAFHTLGIDEVRVFQRPLEDGQVRLLHDDAPAIALNSWRFDDGTARDYGGRQNNATTSGGTAFGPGISGQALLLDGTGEATSSFNGVTMRDSFTVQAWARLTRGDRVATVLAQDGSRMSGFVLQYRPENGRWVFGARAQDADGSPLSYAASHQPAVLNQWVHLTGTYDHAGQQMRLYVNGQLSGTRDQGTLWPASGQFTIGRGKLDGSPAERFTGAIDEARVDMGVVTETEIARRAGWSAPPEGTLGSYVDMAGDHYTAATSEPVRPGYRFERTLGVPVMDEQPGTHLLYACKTGTDSFTSVDAACEGQAPMGTVGRVYTTPPSDVPSVPVHRCRAGTDRFDSRTGCGTATEEALLGYTAAYAQMRRYYSYHSDHWTSSEGIMPGYRGEGRMGWVLLTQQPGTQPLMSCRRGVDEFTSEDPACEGGEVLAALGYVYPTPPEELLTAPLWRCRITADPASGRFTSLHEDCEGRTVERVLGHVLLAPPVPVPES